MSQLQEVPNPTIRAATLETFQTALDQMNADQLWQLAAMCEASSEGLQAMAAPLRRLSAIRSGSTPGS